VRRAVQQNSDDRSSHAAIEVYLLMEKETTRYLSALHFATPETVRAAMRQTIKSKGVTP
jgi:hypothetical protein